MNENNLTRAQQDIADRLNNDEWFATIPVFTDRKANIVSEVQKSLGAVTLKGGKVGTCAVVLQPQATAARSNIPIATMDLEITVLVLEDPQVNNGQTGTGKDALSTARRIVDVLHMFCSQGNLRMLFPDTPTIVPTNDVIAPVSVEVRFKSAEDFRTLANKVAQPGWSTPQTALPYTVTLACATPAADIYYTVDGSYPSPANGTKYLAPFVVASACSVRIGAVASGMIASDIIVTKLS